MLIFLAEKKIRLGMDLQKSSLFLAIGVFALVTLYHRERTPFSEGFSQTTAAPRPEDMARASDGFLDYLRRLDAQGLSPDARCRSVDFFLQSRCS
jgi:hypothetical protein